MSLRDLIQDTSAHYIVRWPPWVGFLIAIAIFGAPYSLLAAWARRVWGSVGLFALVGVVALFSAVVIIGEWKREPSIGGWDLVIATAACVVGFAVAPAATIWFKTRAPVPPSMGRQVGWAVLSIYGAFVTMAVLTVFAMLIYRLAHG